MAKAITTQLKEANIEIERLNKELSNYKSYLNTERNEKEKLLLEVESVHTALDAMFVPRIVKVNYNEKTMTIASRLFAWQAGSRIDNKKTEVE